MKSENGYRTYSQEDLERLQVIPLLQVSRISLDQIAELLAEEKSNIAPFDQTVGLADPRKTTSGYLDFYPAKNHSRTKGEKKNDH